MYRILKVCGLTTVEDALYCSEQGADFLGMVLHPKSPRLCLPETIAEININLKYRPRVLVYGNDDREYIIETAKKNMDDFLFVQLPAHHSGFEKVVQSFGISKIIPVVAVENRVDYNLLEKLKDFDMIIFDTGGIKGSNNVLLDGGTGIPFNWSLLKDVNRNYLVAGGINQENIGRLVGLLPQSRGVDLSGSLESEKGIKDPQKVKIFVQTFRETGRAS